MLFPLSTLLSPALLAETHMAEVSLQFREDKVTADSSGLWFLLIPVVAILLGGIIYKIFNRPKAIVNTPIGMLHELCRVHRISTAGRTLLDQIAEEAELAHPATMLLSVAQFESAIAKAEKRVQMDRKQQATLGMLRRRLFAA